MSERRIPEIIEEPRLGMNTMESPKKLPQFASEKLINAYPGVSVKPRNGCTERMRFTNTLGHEGIPTIFTPHYCHIIKDNKDFVILWHRGTGLNTGEHGFEVWNVTDNSREALDLGLFERPVSVSFTKLYDVVYVAIETEYTTNHTSEFRTKNKIIEYVDGTWIVREMGIDVAPDAPAITVIEGSGKSYVEVDGTLVVHEGKPVISDNNRKSLSTDKYYSYTKTFVRRTDEYVTLQNEGSRSILPWEISNGTPVIGVDEVLLTGKVAISGSAVTGTGTFFTTELAVGKKIRIAGFPYVFNVASITNDTSLLVTANSESIAVSDSFFAVLPDVGDVISTNIYRIGETVGVENLADREVVKTGDGEFARTTLVISGSEEAVAKGATHIRLYRTLSASSEIIAQGLSHRYLIDIPIGAKTFVDDVSDAILTGVTFTIVSTGLEAPPSGRYSFWAGGRLWIGGNENRKGYWYASETPSNTQFPQAFASLFDIEFDYVACDPDDNQKDTGGFEFLGDSYFCKERKIFRLANSDLNSRVQTASHSIGVAFPNSIAFGVDPQGDPCVYFLSESGPAVLTAGGRVRLLTEFRLYELWPTEKEGILKSPEGLVTNWHTRNKVSGAYWNDAYWVMYGDGEDDLSSLSENRILGVFHARDGQSFGGFEFRVDSPVEAILSEPQFLIPFDNTRAYAISHKGAIQRLIQLCDTEAWVDTLDEGDVSVSVEWKPRPFLAGRFRDDTANAKKIINRIDFKDTDGLEITIESDGARSVLPVTYVQERQSGVSNAGYEAYRETEVINLPEGFKGSRFSVLTKKVVPADGDLEIHCPEIEIIPTKTEHEFQSSGGEFPSPVFVVKTDTDPEVDAYQ